MTCCARLHRPKPFGVRVLIPALSLMRPLNLIFSVFWLLNVSKIHSSAKV